MIKEEAEDEIVESASHSKILTKPKQDPKRNEEDHEVSRRTLKGRTIVSGKTLVEMFYKVVCCPVCQADVTLLENVNCASWLLVSGRVKMKCALRASRRFLAITAALFLCIFLSLSLFISPRLLLSVFLSFPPFP